MKDSSNTLSLKIVNPQTGERSEISLLKNIAIEKLTQALLRQLGLPLTDDAGKTISWELMQQLPASRTLDELSIPEYSTLALVPSLVPVESGAAPSLIQIHVFYEDSDYDIALPSQMPVNMLGRLIVEKLALTQDGGDYSDSFELHFEGRVLSPTETLHSAGVTKGASVVIIPKKARIGATKIGPFRLTEKRSNLDRTMNLPLAKPIGEVILFILENLGEAEKRVLPESDAVVLKYKGKELNPGVTLHDLGIPIRSSLELLVRLPLLSQVSFESETFELEIPRDQPVSQLIDLIVHTFHLPLLKAESPFRYELWHNKQICPSDATLDALDIPKYPEFQLLKVEQTIFITLNNLVEGQQHRFYLSYGRPLQELLLLEITPKLRLPPPGHASRVAYRIFYQDKEIPAEMSLAEAGVINNASLDLVISRPNTVYIQVTYAGRKQGVGVSISDDVPVKNILSGLVKKFDLTAEEKKNVIGYKLAHHGVVLASDVSLKMSAVTDRERVKVIPVKQDSVYVSLMHPNSSKMKELYLPVNIEARKLVGMLRKKLAASFFPAGLETSHRLRLGNRLIEPQETLAMAGVSDGSRLALEAAND